MNVDAAPGAGGVVARDGASGQSHRAGIQDHRSAAEVARRPTFSRIARDCAADECRRGVVHIQGADDAATFPERVQSVKDKVESAAERTAPPNCTAELPVIVQSRSMPRRSCKPQHHAKRSRH